MSILSFFRKKMKNVDSSYVFDKAKYHFDSINKSGLDEKQAYVHTGFFFTWLVLNKFTSDFFIEQSGNEIELLNARELAPSSIYMNWDGVLVGSLLNKDGYNFSLKYFDFDKGSYLKDYHRILCEDGGNIFGIQDTWENYDKISFAIDVAYNAWKKQTMS
jgi:hypothetical protein